VLGTMAELRDPSDLAFQELVQRLRAEKEVPEELINALVEDITSHIPESLTSVRRLITEH